MARKVCTIPYACLMFVFLFGLIACSSSSVSDNNAEENVQGQDTVPVSSPCGTIVPATQFCDLRDSTAYSFTTIGSQVWMSQNLAFNTASKKCYGDSLSSCERWGGLYKWSDAMALPDSCDTTLCETLVKARSQGICPSGWHIPDSTEWWALEAILLGKMDRRAEDPGYHAQVMSALYDGQVWGDGNGFDLFDLNIEPSGYFFNNAGDWTYFGGGESAMFWFSDSQNTYYPSSARTLALSNAYLAPYFSSEDRNSYLSVRCVNDIAAITTPPSAKNGVVEIGTQTWKAVNTADQVDWATAMALPANCLNVDCSAQITPKWKGMCPAGFHVPDTNEVQLLIQTLGYLGGDALKSQHGWKGTAIDSGNGSDTYGFTALPLGSLDRGVAVQGYDASFWTASEFQGSVKTWGLSADFFSISEGQTLKDNARSLRCLAD